MDSVRQLIRVVKAQASSDGDGVKIHRITGRDMYAQLDPFLMLDEIYSEDSADYIGGFPSHTHRGFETVTYMLHGAMHHRDHMGNEGLLNDGDVQWMTAGSGVIHSEMPEQHDGLMHGFQLWLNLPGGEKMQAAKYQDFRQQDFPVVELDGGGSVKIIAGEINTGRGLLRSPVTAQGFGVATQPTYLDVTLPADTKFQQQLPSDHNVALYIYRGSTTDLSQRQMGLYSQGEKIVINSGEQGARLLLLAAKPLHEPVKQYGPFVMNTAEEIEQAIKDYNNGDLVA